MFGVLTGASSRPTLATRPVRSKGTSVSGSPLSSAASVYSPEVSSTSP